MADLTTSSAIDTLLQAANQAGIRTAAGLGTLATQDGTFSEKLDISSVNADALTFLSTPTSTTLLASIGGYFPRTVIEVSTTTDTLITAEMILEPYFRYTHASGCEITIPTNTVDPIPVGSECGGFRAGGALTLESTDVIVNNAADIADVGEGGAFMLKKVGVNTWDFIGGSPAVATLTGAETLTNKTLTAPALTEAAIAALDIDWATADNFYKTLAENSTFTFSNLANGRQINVFLTNTASNYTVAWPTVIWTGGAAPTQTVGAKTDIYTFIRTNGITYGHVVQNFS